MRAGRKSRQRGQWELAAAAIAGYLGSSAAEDVNASNQGLSRETRIWQEAMRRTNYQAAKYDMEQAGLNPAMMYGVGKGGPADTPGTPAPQAAVSNVGAGISSAMQAMGVMQGMQQIEQGDANTQVAKAQAAKITSETIDQEINTAMALAELFKTKKEGGIKEIDEWIARRTKFARESSIVAQAEKDVVGADLAKHSFQADVEARKAQSQLKQLEVPAAQAESKFWKEMESAPKYIQLLMRMMSGFRGGVR